MVSPNSPETPNSPLDWEIVDPNAGSPKSSSASPKNTSYEGREFTIEKNKLILSTLHSWIEVFRKTYFGKTDKEYESPAGEGNFPKYSVRQEKNRALWTFKASVILEGTEEPIDFYQELNLTGMEEILPSIFANEGLRNELTSFMMAQFALFFEQKPEDKKLNAKERIINQESWAKTDLAKKLGAENFNLLFSELKRIGRELPNKIQTGTPRPTSFFRRLSSWGTSKLKTFQPSSATLGRTRSSSIIAATPKSLAERAKREIGNVLALLEKALDMPLSTEDKAKLEAILSNEQIRIALVGTKEAPGAIPQYNNLRKKNIEFLQRYSEKMASGQYADLDELEREADKLGEEQILIQLHMNTLLSEGANILEDQVKSNKITLAQQKSDIVYLRTLANTLIERAALAQGGTQILTDPFMSSIPVGDDRSLRRWIHTLETIKKETHFNSDQAFLLKQDFKPRHADPFIWNKFSVDRDLPSSQWIYNFSFAVPGREIATASVTLDLSSVNANKLSADQLHVVFTFMSKYLTASPERREKVFEEFKKEAINFYTEDQLGALKEIVHRFNIESAMEIRKALLTVGTKDRFDSVQYTPLKSDHFEERIEIKSDS